MNLRKLEFNRRLLFFILTAPAMLLAQSAEQPMAADAHPSFLVATIKPSDPNAPGGWDFSRSAGRHLTGVNVDLVTLIRIAYGIHQKQIVGAPDWLAKARYDFDGVPDLPGEPSLKQTQEMWRKLLADRFHLVFHREMREIPIYALTIAKGGPNLKTASPGETMNTGNSGSPGERISKFRSMSMPDFALNMNLIEDRPVVDQTGLAGRYDFTLRWSTDVTHATEADAAPSLFTAIKDQLGLRLDAVKRPVEVFVIDHIDRPSEN